MTDDLVKRLNIGRENMRIWVGSVLLDLYEKERKEAADYIEKLEAANLKQSCIKVDDQMRIEKLEAALREIMGTDELSFVPPILRNVARKALEGKDD